MDHKSKPAFVAAAAARAHRIFKPRNTAAARSRCPVRAVTAQGSTEGTQSAVQVTTTELSIATVDNSSIGAYLARPTQDVAHTAGVVLLSDINGFGTQDTRKVANLLASYSLPTIVPDLFRGNPWPACPPDDTYEAWRQSHPMERVHSDIASTVAAMRELGYANPLGLIGFCFGGGRLMHEISLGEQGTNPAAVAAFYPTRFDPVATGKWAKCPLFFVTGDQDPLVPEEVITALRETLDEENEEMEDCELIIVEDAGHAFAHRPKSEQDAADSEIFLTQAAEWLTKYLTPNKNS